MSKKDWKIRMAIVARHYGISFQRPIARPTSTCVNHNPQPLLQMLVLFSFHYLFGNPDFVSNYDALYIGLNNFRDPQATDWAQKVGWTFSEVITLYSSST